MTQNIKEIKPLSPSLEAAIPVDLLDGLRKGEVYAFVGSGLSIPVGFPTWENLIYKIYEVVKKSQWNNDSDTLEWIEKNLASRPDWVAEVLKWKNLDSFNKAIRDIFKSNTYSGLSIPHALLSLLPFKGYITTNYDTLIEDCVRIFQIDDPQVWNYIEILDNPSLHSDDNLKVFKIHGCIQKNINSLILTSSDYYNLINDQRFVRFLDGIFLKNPMVILGFSLTDRNFRSFVEERYNLYEGNCSPIYAIISSKETCSMEIAAYSSKYNIHLIPISTANNYEELSSLLISLFCLTYQVDSKVIGPAINNLLVARLHHSGKYQIQPVPTDNADIVKASALLSVFQEPIDIGLFTTICIDYQINLSPAHLKVAFSVTKNNITIKQKIEPSDSDIEFVARWLSNHIEAVAFGQFGRYLTIYRKKFLSKLSNTILFLLSNKVGWDAFVGDSSESVSKIERISEFYRQEGDWLNWINVCDDVEHFIDKKSSTFIELMKTKFWVFFWMRRFEDARKLFVYFPELGHLFSTYAYQVKIMYMTPRSLKKLVKQLEKASPDHFNLSFLGRSLARLSLKSKSQSLKKLMLEKAKGCLQSALDLAKKDNDMVDVAVQSWYLSIICTDLNHEQEANEYFSETKRLDESIMNRIPGIAWLKLAEYRMSLKNKPVDKNRIAQLKTLALEAMEKMGILDAIYYIDNDYYY